MLGCSNIGSAVAKDLAESLLQFGLEVFSVRVEGEGEEYVSCVEKEF